MNVRIMFPWFAAMSMAAALASVSIVASAAPATAVVGAHIHVSADLPVISRGTLRIRDGRVIEVGADVVPADGDRVIDADGLVVTPGLVDSHSVAGLAEVSRVDEDYQIEDYPLGAGFRVADAFNHLSPHVGRMRRAGVTVAQLVPQRTDDIFAGQGALVSLDGSPSSVLTPASAQFVVVGERGREHAGGSRAVTLQRVRQALDDAREFARRRNAWRDGRSRPYRDTPLDLDALQSVLAGQQPLVARVERVADILGLMAIADEYEIRLVLLGASEAWKVRDDLASAGIAVVVNPFANIPNSFDEVGARLDNAVLLDAAGVKVAISFNSTGLDGRSITQLAGNAVARGLPWKRALRAITLTPAEIWGIAAERGSLEPGKVADLVLWDGDPLEVTSAVTKMMIGGVWQDMTTRQTRLRDRYVRPDAAY